MSQSSFLEAVVTWDQQQCHTNLNEALPKLITALFGTEVLQEEVGVLKIICQSFLPVVDIHEAEERVFSKVSQKTCEVCDRVLGRIQETVGDVQVQDELQQEILALLEVLLELIDCVTNTVKYVQGASNAVDIASIHSIPYSTVHILKGTYQHCKDSVSLYGDVLAGITEPLAVVFKKAHILQMAFLGLLDKISVSTSATEQDIQDLCYICYGLFDVCQIVTALDVKVIINLWKAMSRFVTTHKQNLKDDLDIDRVIDHLCSEIESGYEYLFQLAPPLIDSQEITLSQGDERAFQKSVKVLGFQMKVLVSFVKEYVDYISSCVERLIHLLITLHRNLPPCLSAPKITPTHVEEIRRQLLNATEPLLGILNGNRKFLEFFTATELEVEAESCLAVLLIYTQLLDILPRQPRDVLERWICPKVYPEDRPRSNILSCIFTVVSKCFIELSVPVHVPGVMCSGKPQREVTLYEHICTHMCGFIGSLPASHFAVVEEVLLENLLSTIPCCSLLATDVWSFMARYGSADLCYHHVTVLVDLCLEQKLTTSTEVVNILGLVRRFVKFLAAEHQKELFKRYPPDVNTLPVWSELPLCSFTSSVARDLLEQLMSQCVKILHNFNNKSEKTKGDLYTVCNAIGCLSNIYHNMGTLQKYVSPSVQNSVVDKLDELWSVVIRLEWSACPVVQLCIQKMLFLSAMLLPYLSNDILLNILTLISEVLSSSNVCLKLSALYLLRHAGKAKLSPSAQQSRILSKLVQVFSEMICDQNCLVHHSALVAFSHFAEETPHESVVPECMETKPGMQDCVVGYLNKVPHVCEGLQKEEYLQYQLQKLNLSLEGAEKTTADQDDKQREQPALKRQRVGDDQVDRALEAVISTVEKQMFELENLCRQKPPSALLVNRMNAVHRKMATLFNIKDCG